jgi:hypothetical protein
MHFGKARASAALLECAVDTKDEVAVFRFVAESGSRSRALPPCESGSPGS